MVQTLAKSLHDAEKNILAKNQQLAELQRQLSSQKQSLDAQELKEFLHVENQVCTGKSFSEARNICRTCCVPKLF